MNKKWIKWGLTIALAIGVVKFYHYNYIANTFGQARQLKLTGLTKFVCKEIENKPQNIDQCGGKSIWADPDWGITAYVTIYGIESELNAKEIANFMVEARRRDGQTNIPMDLEVFKLPRSQANSYRNTRIFHHRFDKE